MNQLQKYTWLIDTIRRAGKISHKDLSDRWSRNKDLSDGHELHRATFNRWRDAIYGGRSIESDVMHRHISVVTESGRDGEAGSERATERVDKDVDALAVVLGEHSVDVATVEVPASEVAFE